MANYPIEVKSGQQLSVKTSSSTFNGEYCISWRNAGGTSLASKCQSKTSSGFWQQQTFSPTPGTYTLRVDPSGTTTGSVTLTVWDSTDITGATITPTTEGETKAFAIEVPGQKNWVTFSGTKGQLVTLKVTEPNFAGTMSIWAPSGSKVSGSEKSFSKSGTAKAEVTPAETGTYKIKLEGSGEETGSAKLSAYLGSHVAWLSPPRTEAELVSYTTPYADSGRESRNADGQSLTHLASHVHSSGVIAVGGRRKTSSPLLRRRGSAAAIRGFSDTSRNRKAQDTRVSRTGPSVTRNRARGLRVITPAMRAYHPDANSAWHPRRTRRGVQGWAAGESRSPWAKIAQLQAGSGTTALAGQVLKVNGLPIAGVRVSLEGSSISTQTDEAGRFLLSGASAGHQILIVDGESSPGHGRYGSYEVGVELVNHKTTTLDYTVWLTPLNKDGDHRIASPTPRETRLTTPRIPGLEVRIPAGTVIRNAAGRVVRKLNISPVPVDRPPFPLPPFVEVPLYFTVQPGRAYLSKGAQIVYPNWAHLPPGHRVEFWNYDANDKGWYVYGNGTVTKDGKQVVPDPGVRVWEFTGAMISGGTLPSAGPIAGGSASGGDPVDLYSGLFTYHRTDLTLPDAVPISIERTYRPQDSSSYAFGTGTESLYETRLWSNNNYQEADLILPDGGRVHYVRISAGTGWTDAVYRSTSNPGTFHGSEIKWDGATPGFDLTLTNGYTFVFGEVAPLQAIRDPYGNTLTLTRTNGQNGNITKITSPHGRWVKLSYDGSNRITEATDNGGRHLKYTYTSGRLTKVEGLAGRTTEYEYDASGRMKAIVDGRGNKYLQTTYDANGRVEKQTAADGGIFEFAYKTNEAGKVEATTLTDPLGRQREVQFNSEGFPTSETEAAGTELAQTSTIERQPKTGLILSETDPLGGKTEYEYDSNGNVEEVTRLAGTSEAVTSKFAYQAGTDRLTEATDPLGHTSKFEYGSKGELLKETNPLGNETTIEYNGDGQPTEITDPEGETSKLGYEAGDLVSVTNPLGNTTSQFVDALGRVRAITLPGGQRYLYGYNEADQLTSEKAPSGAETAIEYDADGDPTRLTDPLGGETTSTYDSMDRLESETDPLEHTSEWNYDKAGQLTEAVDRRGKISQFGYDGLGRVVKASFGVSGLTAESAIEYGYDEGNRLTDVSDSASGEYTLSHDNLDRLTGVEGPTGSVGYEYDAAGRRTAMSLPGSRSVSYAYDNADRMTEVASEGQSASLAYDKASRLERLTLPDGIEQLYGYDKAGQPTSIAYKHGESTLGEIDYAYDADGRTEAMWGSYARLALPEALKSAKYNAANQLVEREGKALSYDADGNLTSDGSSEYGWDARGQLAEISGATSASFGYDPFGRRTSKTLGGTTTSLLYDGPNVAQESVGGSVAANLLSGLSADQLFSRATGEGTDSYLSDKLGSTIALANSSAGVETTYAYDPFGGSTVAGEPKANPFQFTGRENDGTGLQYNRARYYSPELARFISQDPVGAVGLNLNSYEYASDNPIDRIDPTGYFDIGPVSINVDIGSPQEVGERFVGAVDGETFGLTNSIRNAIGDNNVDRCSANYQNAYSIGHLTSTVAAGIGGGAAGGEVLGEAPAAVRAIGGGSIGGVTQSVASANGHPSASEVGRGAVLGGAGGAAGDFFRGSEAANTTANEQLAGSATGNGLDALSGHPPSIGQASCGS